MNRRGVKGVMILYSKYARKKILLPSEIFVFLKLTEMRAASVTFELI